MSELQSLIAAMVCSGAGMAWLALAMKTHWEQVRGGAVLSAGTVRMLRALGAAALFASLLLCMASDHPSMAVLVWFMSLAAAALLIAFTLSWYPRGLAWLVPWARRGR